MGLFFGRLSGRESRLYLDALGFVLIFSKPFTESTDSMMDNISSNLGYFFKDKRLIELALTHKSFSLENNERLEFLGDAILNLYVSEKLYA